MTAEKSNGHGGLLVIAFIFAVISLVWVMVNLNISFTRHARTSHPEAVNSIENCFNGGGTLSPTYKLDNGRWGQFCNDGGKNNYWRIFECHKGDTLVITQFKQGVRRLANYIRNHNMVAEEFRC